MTRYLFLLSIILLVGCGSEPPKGTIRVAYEEGDFKIYEISRGYGNGYCYVTNRGAVTDTRTDTRTEGYRPPVYMYQAPIRR